MLRLTLCFDRAQAMLRNAQECSPSAQVKAAAAHVQALKQNQREKKVKTDLCGSHRQSESMIVCHKVPRKLGKMSFGYHCFESKHSNFIRVRIESDLIHNYKMKLFLLTYSIVVMTCIWQSNDFALPNSWRDPGSPGQWFRRLKSCHLALESSTFPLG